MKHIEEKMKEFAMNIDEFEIGESILDKDGSKCRIINKTKNSIEVWIGRKGKKGVDSNNWFTMQWFNRRFKKKNG